MKTIILIVVLAVLIGASVFAYNMLSKQETLPNNTNTSEETKTKAPDFAVIDSSGNTVKLSDMFGKPIVLNFWASWCPPCKSEMPDFDKVYKEMNEDVTFMMVDLVDGMRETKDIGAKYIEEQGFSFPVYFDETQNAVNTYNIMSIPTTIFIDKKGYIVSKSQGMISENSLRNKLENIF